MVVFLGAVVLASGASTRFGPENKLLAPYQGKPLLYYVLRALPMNRFKRRLVVTRTPQIAQLAQAMGYEALLHAQPDISDTIRLGVEAMGEMDGCLFSVGDQPLLGEASVCRLADAFSAHPHHILRLCKEGRPGNPVIFPKSCFQELCALPPKNGGNYLMTRHPERVLTVEADSPKELWDVDTLSDYQALPGE